MTLIIFSCSDCYYWAGLGCKSFRCCPWWNFVWTDLALIFDTPFHIPYLTKFIFYWCRGQALCTTAAVLGGKSLASQISEKMVSNQSLSEVIHFHPKTLCDWHGCDANVSLWLKIQVALSSGLLFLVFGLQSLLSTAVESWWMLVILIYNHLTRISFWLYEPELAFCQLFASPIPSHWMNNV